MVSNRKCEQCGVGVLAAAPLESYHYPQRYSGVEIDATIIGLTEEVCSYCGERTLVFPHVGPLLEIMENLAAKGTKRATIRFYGNSWIVEKEE